MGLKDIFSQGQTPDPAELRGYYTVRLVTGLLPDLRFLGHRKFFPDSVDREDSARGGYNEFLGRVRIGSFKIDSGDSALGDGQRVLRINYNRPGNPFWLRPLNDELKRLQEGYYLGRGVFVVGGRAFNSFYFSVERQS